jgi:hypothetical protein
LLAVFEDAWENSWNSLSAFPESDRQPPQAAAPLWANRRRNGRPKIIEKWKR